MIQKRSAIVADIASDIAEQSLSKPDRVVSMLKHLMGIKDKPINATGDAKPKDVKQPTNTTGTVDNEYNQEGLSLPAYAIDGITGNGNGPQIAGG